MAFNGRFLLDVAYFSAQNGADLKALIRATGHSEASLSDPNCKVESEAYNRMLRLALDMTGDTLSGLHMGEGMNLAGGGLIVQIIQSSSTVREALKYCCDFANLGCSSLPMSMEEADGQCRIRMRPDPVW